MLMSQMKSEECREFLANHEMGRLACARNGQPYIVPIYFVYETEHLYGFTTPGQKVEWMRANPLICVEADEILTPDTLDECCRSWELRGAPRNWGILRRTE